MFKASLVYIVRHCLKHFKSGLLKDDMVLSDGLMGKGASN